MTAVSESPSAAIKPLLRGWSHVVSFAVVGVIGLFMLAYSTAPPRTRLTLVVYLLGTLAMFGVSALYHRGSWSDQARAVWKRLDHSTIFLAIAGAYTPISVACLDGGYRVAVLCAAWGGAVVGISLQWLPIHVPRALFTIVYVVVGWSMAVALPQLFDGIGAVGFALVLAGGVAYTVGAVVYALKRPDPWPQVFGFHEVFHLLTVIGAGLHLAAIAFVVAPKL
ncbi:MAG: rane protein hemolysin [Ilumatobacteraceae bacterium]|nr:rane protein hemolysin [Ilumatobacteraceae bacterium]